MGLPAFSFQIEIAIGIEIGQCVSGDRLVFLNPASSAAKSAELRAPASRVDPDSDPDFELLPNDYDTPCVASQKGMARWGDRTA